MVARAYVPDAGDLVWLTFDPQAGHEQRGRRPALILSSRVYNAKARLAVACPVTSQVKGYPFEVALPTHGTIGGVVLADHVKNLDWEARQVVFEAKAPAEVLADVRERLRALLGLSQPQPDSRLVLGVRKALTNLGAPRRVIVHARLLPHTQSEVGTPSVVNCCQL